LYHDCEPTKKKASMSTHQVKDKKVMVDDSPPPPSSSSSQETDAFDTTAAKGTTDGLFQQCMKAIRSGHREANRIRAAIVVAGLFTDKALYRETVTLFYLVTKELEIKLHQLRDTDEICAKLLSLGYTFTFAYEQDMATLYSESSSSSSSTWKDQVQHVWERNEATRSYCEMIRHMESGEDLAGVAFCLWGALIIGGGAVAQPRVKNLWGKDAVHVFDSVIGPGRNARSQQFTTLWDNLAKPETPQFAKIVDSCQRCMQKNNELIASVKRNPWWLPYVTAAGVGVVACALVWFPKAVWKTRTTS
jgi:hypothetical protein